nr:hypothetical protein [Micromonospora sp. DSM 115978]
MPGQQPSRFPTALIAIAALACPLTACAADDPTPSPQPTADAAPARASEAEEAAASDAALAAYAGYLAALQKAEQAGNPQHSDLKKYLADPLLTRVRLAIRDAKENGAMRTGSLISDPTVTSVTLDTVPATVSIQDCVDSTRYRLVYRKNKSPVPDTARGRYLATATANRFPDGRWLINASAAHEDQPC